MMYEWQRMENAPKDGKFLDLWVFGNRWTDCRWCKPLIPKIFMEIRSEVREDIKETWCKMVFDQYHENSHYVPFGEMPTHWMRVGSP